VTALLHEIAHLGHAELLTPEPDRSLWFFTEVLGLTENGRNGDSVYLRTWVFIETGPHKHAIGTSLGLATIASFHTHGTPPVDAQPVA
jgi:catechol 2,3-dioxygenase-like lactoylglutathione lyase family enzyme